MIYLNVLQGSLVLLSRLRSCVRPIVILTGKVQVGGDRDPPTLFLRNEKNREKIVSMTTSNFRASSFLKAESQRSSLKT